MESLFPSVHYLRSNRTVVEYDPRGARTEVVVEGGLEVFALEFGLYVFSQVVKVSAHLAALGVVDRVDSNFNPVGELEHRLNERAFQQLVPDFLAHLYSLSLIINYLYHLFHFIIVMTVNPSKLQSTIL